MKVSHPERSSGLDVHRHEHGEGSWKYPEASAFSKVAAGCVSVPGRILIGCLFICGFSGILAGQLKWLRG